MNIIIPVYITDHNKIDRILDQLYVTIESYFFHGNSGTFIIYTNDDFIEKGINHYKAVFERHIIIIKIDFEKVWQGINLPINEVRTRREFIIAKTIIPFIFDDDYLLMDWDILTTGKINPEFIKSDKIRLFNPKLYDGITLRQNSMIRGLTPENESIGKFRWVNSGMVYYPKELSLGLIKEYWEKYHSIREQVYRGIYLFDIIGDELIYNLMLLDNDPRIEECNSYNLNTVIRNFYYTFDNIRSMFNFGNTHPKVLNVHFAGGHVKPFNVTVDENNSLSYQIDVEDYSISKRSLKWLFDMSEHRMGSYHYNALLFSIIWQYTKYSIKEKLTPEIGNTMSQRYLDFFNKGFVE